MLVRAFPSLASFVLLFASVFRGQRPIHYLQAALLFLLINAVHWLAFPSLHGLVWFFPAALWVLAWPLLAFQCYWPTDQQCFPLTLNADATFAPLNAPGSWFFQVLPMTFPSSPSRNVVIRVSIAGAWWSLLKNSINWDALLYFALIYLLEGES